MVTLVIFSALIGAFLAVRFKVFVLFPAMLAVAVLNVVIASVQGSAPGLAQHHDKGHQGTACAADHEMTKMPPVDLRLLAGQAAQT